MDHLDYSKRHYGDISRLQLKILFVSFAIAAMVLLGLAGLVAANLH